MSPRPRGFIDDWTPQAATMALIDQVKTVLAEYRDQLPLTLRQIFYRLVGAYEYEKTEKAYKRLGTFSLIHGRYIAASLSKAAKARPKASSNPGLSPRRKSRHVRFGGTLSMWCLDKITRGYV